MSISGITINRTPVSTNSEKRRFKVGRLAAWTSPWAGKSSPVAEEIPAIQATTRPDHDLFPLRLDGSLNMIEMRMDFLFPDAQIPRQILGGQLIRLQKRNHFLTQGFQWVNSEIPNKSLNTEPETHQFPAISSFSKQQATRYSGVPSGR
jgi:hypothetical protein